MDLIIKALIEQAAPNALITLPAGTFELWDVEIPATVTLEGHAAGTTVLVQPEDERTGAILRPGNQARVQNLTLRGRRDRAEWSENAHLVWVEGSAQVALQRLVLDDPEGDGVLSSGDDLSIRRCEVRQTAFNRNAISIIGGTGITIASNTITGNSLRPDMPGGIDIEPDQAGQFVSRVRITNNVLQGGDYAIQLWGLPHWRPEDPCVIDDVLIVGNRFDRVPVGVLAQGPMTTNVRVERNVVVRGVLENIATAFGGAQLTTAGNRPQATALPRRRPRVLRGAPAPDPG